jgi:RNA polymerase sigma factor (sigma-70 family)
LVLASGAEADYGCAAEMGDRSEYEAIYRRHVGYVLTVLQGGFSFTTAAGERSFFRVESTFDAEELCQEVFSQFFRQYAARTFDRSRPIEPYIRGIAVNLALKSGRRRGREVLMDQPEPGSVEVRDRLEDAECERLMAEFRAGLNDTERSVIDGYAEEPRPSQAELGARVGLSRDQVYRTLTAVRRRALEFFRSKGWRDEM